MNKKSEQSGSKRRYIVFGIAFMFIVVILTCVILPKTDTGKDIIKRQIQSALKGSINGELEFEIEGVSILGSVFLKDVSLWTEDRDFVAATPMIRANYNPLRFLRGRVSIDEIETEGLIFAIENKQGKSTMSGLFTSGKETQKGRNLQIDLSKVSLKKSFFVTFSSTPSSSPFTAKEKITTTKLRRMQANASGPEKIAEGVGAVIIGDLDANLMVNIDTNGGTNIRVTDLSSVISMDRFLKTQKLQASELSLSFFDGEMGAQSGPISIGKKASTKSIRFYGHFPEAESEEWFDTHRLEVEELKLSRGYLHLVSGSQINPKHDPVLEFQSQGALPNRMRYATKIKVADSFIQSVGKVEHLLDSKNIKIDSLISSPLIQATDFIPLDTKIKGRAVLRVAGEFKEQPDLQIKGLFSEFDVLDYRFEKAAIALTWSDGIVGIEHFRLQWGDIFGDLSGQVADTGSFNLKFLADAIGSTKAQIKINANGVANWDAPEIGSFLQTINSNGDWILESFENKHIKIQQTRGDFDFDLINPKTCIEQATDSATNCYPKKASLRVKSEGRGIGHKKDSISEYNLKMNMQSNVSESIDLETLLSSLSGTFDTNVNAASIGTTKIKSTKAKAKIKGNKQGKFGYKLEISSGEIRQGERRLGNLWARASGKFNTDRSRTKIRNLSSKGTLKIGTFSEQETKVSGLDATFDLRKTGDDFLGSILFSAKESELAGRQFSELKGDISADKNETFDLSIKGIQRETEEKNAETKTVNINVKGSFRDGLSIDELDLGDGGYRVNNRVRIQGDHFEFDDVQISRRDQKIRISGDVHKGRSQNLNVELAHVQLADLSEELGVQSLQPYKGALNGTIKVNGTASSPSGTFDISISDFYHGELGPIDATITGLYRDDQLDIKTIKVDFFNEVTLLGNAMLPLSISQDGSIIWYPDRPLSSEQKIISFRCANLVNHFTKNRDLNISGQAAARLSLSGTLNKPLLDTEWTFEELGATGFINQTPLSLGPFNGNFRAKHEPTKTNKAKFASSLSVESDIGSLLISASSRAEFPKMVQKFLTQNILPDYRELDFKIGIQTEDFKIKKLQIGPLVDANAEGILNLSASVQGTLKSPSMKGQITLESFGWTRYRDFNFQTAFSATSKALTIQETRLGWDGDEILTASAEIPNPIELLSSDRELDESPLNFSVDFVPFELKKLSTFDYKFASLSGTLKGNISAHGSFRELKVDSKIAIDDVLYGDGKKGETNLGIRLENEKLEFEAAILRAGDNMTFDISLPFSQDFSGSLTDGTWFKEGPISGHLRSKNTPLAGLMPGALYKNYVENLEGNLFSDVRISGTTKLPDLKGRLKIENAAFTLRDYGRRFEKVGLEMNLLKNKIEISNFHAVDGTGSIDAGGFAVVEDWKVKELKANLDAKRFSIEGFSSVPAFISANAKVSGDFSQPSSRAQVDVSGLKVVLPENQNTNALATELDEDIIIIENQSDELSDLTENKASVVDKIYAKMKVNINDGEVIHTVGNVRFLGQLDIDLANIGALITGDLKTVSGKVETFGKIFEVKPGLMTFRGLDPPNPFLEIEAHYKLSRQITDVVGEASSGEARAIVRITGPLSNFKQQYSADPQMSEADVLYILITDQAPGSAGVGQAEAGLALGAASSGLTGIATMIVGSANKVLPDIAKVDVVRVEAGQNEGKVEVGKYLSRQLFVLYRYRFGAEEGTSQHEVTFEYRFLPAWILDFQVGDADQGEVNLLWDIY